MWNIMFWRYSMMWKVLGKFQLLGCWTIWGHIRASQLGCFKFCYVLGWKRGKICAIIEIILESVVWLPAEFWVFVEALHTQNRSKTRTLNVVWTSKAPGVITSYSIRDISLNKCDIIDWRQLLRLKLPQLTSVYKWWWALDQRFLAIRPETGLGSKDGTLARPFDKLIQLLFVSLSSQFSFVSMVNSVLSIIF